ncbi:hypothetical protein PAL_GLEAN10015750 [Pteropus alecto]|uniref:Uncharacterized protein n=1 Tax=Pteropus alecto TaxID=9402 RepID=L5L1K6_PTEAL|nr:hypothetical protein PAL_GLEAN10015750 [Pteropus alecto]
MPRRSNGPGERRACALAARRSAPCWREDRAAPRRDPAGVLSFRQEGSQWRQVREIPDSGELGGVTFPLRKRLHVRVTSPWGSIIFSILSLGTIPRVHGRKRALIQNFDCEYSFD